MVIHRFLARFVALLALVVPVFASAQLTIKPITWDVIGLDSNKPANGPQDFPVGARVCGPAGTTTVALNFTTGDGTSPIQFAPGSLPSVDVTLPGQAPGGCADAYFTLRVDKSSKANYTATRGYTLTATQGGSPAIYPESGRRQFYVEYLVSQNRNSISSVSLNGGPPVQSGSLDVTVGQEYILTLRGKTATNGYEQLEAFLTLPNNLFRVDKVRTTYTANSSTTIGTPSPGNLSIDELYGDACVWEPDPDSANYKSCLGVGKVGGGVIVEYTLRVIGGAGSSVPLTALLYDFSGSSYHYNSDFSAFNVTVRIAAPPAPDLSVTKQYSPAVVSGGGTSTLTITIFNNSAFPVSGISFSDALTGAGGAGNSVRVANPPAASALAEDGVTPCGTFTPAANDSTLTFSNGTLAASGRCVIKVDVAAPSANGVYPNQTSFIAIDGIPTTARSNVANLTVDTVAPPRLTKQFLTNPLTLGGTSTLRFTLFNDNASTGLQGVGFTDTYPTSGGGALSTVGTPVQNTCGVGTVALSGTAPQITVSGVTLAAAGTCVIDIAISASAAGSYANTTSTITGTAQGTTTPILTGAAATDTLVVLAPTGNLQVSKDFDPASIVVNGTSTLTITLTNATGKSLTSIAFTDDFPAGLLAVLGSATPTGCGPNALAAATNPGSPAKGRLTLTDGALPANATQPCKVTVTVQAITVPANGTLTNSTGTVTFNADGAPGSAGAATADLQVSAPTPKLELGKFVSDSPSGPWLPTVVVRTQPPASPPAKIYYKFVAQNTGNVAISNISVTDPALPGPSNCFAGLTLQPDSDPVECILPLAGIDPVAGAVENTATASGTATVNGQTVPVASLPATATYFGVVRDLTLIKEVSTSPNGPWSQDLLVPTGTAFVYYRFTAINGGNQILSNVTITDVPLGGIASACTAALSPLDPLEARRCVVAAAAAPSGIVSNEATASASPPGGGQPVPSNTATARYTVVNASKVADLRVAKSVFPTGAVAPGAPLTYTIVVTNDGGSDADLAVLRDPPPIPSSSFNVPLNSPVTCAATAPAECPTTLTVGALQASGLTIPKFPSGSSLTFTFSGTAGSTASITNTAFIDPPAGTLDPNLVDNRDSAFTVISGTQSGVDLYVVKQVDKPVAGVGEILTYRVTVGSLPSPNAVGVSGAKFLDPQPLGVEYTEVTCEGALPAGSFSCPPVDLFKLNNGLTIPFLAPGNQFDLIIKARVLSAGLSLGAILNNATISAPNGGPLDLEPLNNFGTAFTTVAGATLAGIDLLVQKTGPSSIGSGGILTYTILVKNNGLGTIPPGSKLFDALTGNFVTTPTVECRKPASSQADCPPAGDVNWGNITGPGITMGAIPALSSLEFLVSFTAGSSGVLFNTASVSPPPNTFDANPRDNSSSVSTTIISSEPGADLEVRKIGDRSSANPGDRVAFTILVTNRGSVSADGALLRDQAVANFVADTVTCGLATGDAICPQFVDVQQLQSGVVIPRLPSFGSLTFTLSGTATGGNIVNVATVFSPPGTTDRVLTNNASSWSINVGGGGSEPGAISGFVWYDTNGNRTKDPGEPPRAGWKVEVVRGGSVLASAFTTPEGFYSFTGLPPANDYVIRFTTVDRPAVPGGGPVNGDTAGNGGSATPGSMWLTGIKVPPGGTVLNQSLPINPSGVVYAAAARVPVPGARVTLLFNGAPANPAYVAGGSNSGNSASGGQYAFFLLPGAPSGTWGLSVAPSANFAGTPSALIPPSDGSGFFGGSVGTNGVPQQGQNTTYYLAFPLPTQDLTNNNIPLDAAATQSIPATSPALLALMALLLASAAGWTSIKRRRSA